MVLSADDREKQRPPALLISNGILFEKRVSDRVIGEYLQPITFNICFFPFSSRLSRHGYRTCSVLVAVQTVTHNCMGLVKLLRRALGELSKVLKPSRVARAAYSTGKSIPSWRAAHIRHGMKEEMNKMQNVALSTVLMLFSGPVAGGISRVFMSDLELNVIMSIQYSSCSRANYFMTQKVSVAYIRIFNARFIFGGALEALVSVDKNCLV